VSNNSTLASELQASATKLLAIGDDQLDTLKINLGGEPSEISNTDLIEIPKSMMISIVFHQVSYYFIAFYKKTIINRSYNPLITI
jgi:hypothetical protein